MASMSATVASIYQQYADPDGFLYLSYASQEAFGGEAFGSDESPVTWYHSSQIKTQGKALSLIAIFLF